MNRVLNFKLLRYFLLLIISTPLGYAEEPSRPSTTVSAIGVEPTLQAIYELEAESDPKCYATANRVEDYLFGTPLLEEARFVKIDLQKKLIRDLWSQASRNTNAEVVLLVDLKRVTDPLLTIHQSEHQLLFTEGVNQTEIQIKENQYQHYSSIAYSLRAILAVKQELLIVPDSNLKPMQPEAENFLQEFLDYASVFILAISDQEARLNNEKMISEKLYQKNWDQYFSMSNADNFLTLKNPQPNDKESVFESILDKKINAYQKYNETSELQMSRVFFDYLKKAYARYDVPKQRGAQTKLWNAYMQAWEIFSDKFWQESVEASDSALIQAAEVARVLQRLLPHDVNAYEDVRFFPSLKTNGTLTIESFDLDSFRDLGLHWKILKSTFERQSMSSAEPDPFAAEILAEGIAQYAVLLMRLSGQISQENRDSFVNPDVVHQATQMIEKRVTENNQSRKLVTTPSTIASSPLESSSPQKKIFSYVQPTGFSFTHETSHWLQAFRKKHSLAFLEFSGGGIVAEDINADGFEDLLLVGGQGNMLFLNDQKGGFLSSPFLDEPHGEARQPLFADLDNDGDQDLFITYVHESHRLYENLGNGKFVDRTDQAKLGGKGYVGGPATMFDYDRDGLLDVYIGYFGNYLDHHFPQGNRNSLNASPNRLFKNLGDFRFKDVTRKTKTGHRGWAQAITHSDLNQDGWQDLIISNDFGRNAVLMNLGNGRFKDRAEDLNVYDYGHSMNVGIADLNLDRIPDIFISNIGILVKDDKYTLPYSETPIQFNPASMSSVHILESNFLHLSSKVQSKLGITYQNSEAIQRSAAYSGWAWDADFFDYDHDGDEDLYLVNGAVKQVEVIDSKRGRDAGIYPVNYGENRNVLYENKEGSLFPVAEDNGADVMSVSRSAAYLDYDHDGDLDIVVNNYESPAFFLQNQTEKLQRNWARIQLVGSPTLGSSRDAIGAQLWIQTKDGQSSWREVRSTTGYLSAHSKIQHVGLGKSEVFDLTIRWPSGHQQVLKDLRANQWHRIEQP